MRRILKSMLLGVMSLAVLLLLVAGGLWIGANTAPGRRAIESTTAALTGGTVRIAGLSGRLPGEIRIGRLTLTDAAGVWLTAENVALEWSPGRLLSGEAAIDFLGAGSIALDRLPAASNDQSGGMSVPAVRLILRRLEITRLAIGPAIAGQSVTLAVRGSGDATGPDTADLRLAITTPNASDHYLIDASIDPVRLRATLAIAENAHGFLASLAGLPDLGEVTANASVDGPMKNLAAKATVTAGPLRAETTGTIDAIDRAADLTISATAPAMVPGPGVAWSSIRLDGRVNGPLISPNAAATLTIAGLTADGAGVGSLRADISGTAGGPLTLHATAADVHVPGPDPMVLAHDAMILDVTTQPAQPARFSLRHPLIEAEGTVSTQRATVRLTLPELTPFAALGGVDLRGRTAMDIQASRAGGVIEIAAQGDIGIAGGMAPVPALIGDAGTINLTASIRGETANVTRLTVTGRALEASVKGQLAATKADLDWTAHFGDMAALQPTLSGTADAHGHVGASPDALSAVTELSADVAAKGYRSGLVRAHVDIDGPFAAPRAKLTAEGNVLDAPLSLAMAADRPNGGFHLTIEHGAWKSLATSGTLDLARDATIPTGDIQVSMSHLGDLEPLLGRPVSGEFSASLGSANGSVKVTATIRRLNVPGAAAIASGALDATIANPADRPDVNGTLTLDDFATGGMRGSARMTGNGPLEALAVTLSSKIADLMGTPAQIDAIATVDAPGRMMALSTMHAAWRGETIRLLAPAKFVLASNAATVDRLRLGLRTGALEVAGRAGETLDVRARLTDLPVDLAAMIAPEYAADGTVSGEAALTGPADRPDGTIRVKATGVRMRTGTGRGLPLANATLNATLRGGTARLEAAVIAGGSNVSLTGQAPLSKTGRVDLRAAGSMDLAILQPLVAAQGRTVRGRAVLDVGIGGSIAAPKADGTVRLSDGDFADYQLGAHVSRVTATIRVEGESIRIAQLDGSAGPGTISAAGGIDLAGARRVDLTLKAQNARLLSSDLVVATGDANVSLSGALGGAMTVGGTIAVRRADITVPERLPGGIATIPVRIAGRRYVPPPPPPPPPDVALNVTLDAPGQIYIRGRGLDVELGGKVEFGGTAERTEPKGALRLRRGTVSLAGISLALTDGTIDFTGATLTDPTLRLVASYSTATLASTLTVSGPVRDPKIVLSSVPEVPQDEILSQILFNTTKAQLTPFQVAQIAAALASLSGVSTGFGDPLGSLRNRLGLDQLTVGSSPGSGSPSLQAGRYLMPGVRLGVQQSATGSGTQGTVDVDLTKHLRLETTAGRGTSTATSGGDAASVGLKYQMEY